jgi:tellurite resistance protein TehA-like permease
MGFHENPEKPLTFFFFRTLNPLVFQEFETGLYVPSIFLSSVSATSAFLSPHLKILYFYFIIIIIIIIIIFFKKKKGKRGVWELPLEVAGAAFEVTRGQP